MVTSHPARCKIMDPQEGCHRSLLLVFKGIQKGLETSIRMKMEKQQEVLLNNQKAHQGHFRAMTPPTRPGFKSGSPRVQP